MPSEAARSTGVFLPCVRRKVTRRQLRQSEPHAPRSERRATRGSLETPVKTQAHRRLHGTVSPLAPEDSDALFSTLLASQVKRGVSALPEWT